MGILRHAHRYLYYCILDQRKLSGSLQGQLHVECIIVVKPCSEQGMGNCLKSFLIKERLQLVHQMNLGKGLPGHGCYLLPENCGGEGSILVKEQVHSLRVFLYFNISLETDKEDIDSDANNLSFGLP